MENLDFWKEIYLKFIFKRPKINMIGFLKNGQNGRFGAKWLFWGPKW